MLKGRCPDCGQPIEAEKREGATFRCAACGSSFRLALKNGKLIARRIEQPPGAVFDVSSPAGLTSETSREQDRLDAYRRAAQSSTADPPYASQGERSYWGSMTSSSESSSFTDSSLPYTLPNERKSSAPPRKSSASPRKSSAPPRKTSRPAAGAAFEVLPRIEWFLLLFLMLAVNVFHIPLFQVVANHKDVTLPGIGTMRGEPDLEKPGRAGFTTGYVTETILVRHTRRADSHEVRYRFQVNGQTYTYCDGSPGKDRAAHIEEDVWYGLNEALKNGQQPTLEVKYLLTDPWENRPVAGFVAPGIEWVFAWLAVFFLTVTGLSEVWRAYKTYRRAAQAAQMGQTGKLRYWEIRPKKR